MSKQVLNELRFKTPGELLDYRNIHIDAIKAYENSMESDVPEIAAAIVRHKEYVRVTDILLHDAFLGTVKDRMVSGVNIDPLLFPGVNVPEFLKATKMLTLTSGVDTQKQLEFIEAQTAVEEAVKSAPKAAVIVPIASVDKTGTEGMTAIQAIRAIFKGIKKPELLTVIQAAKVHCYKVRKLDPEKLPLNEVLKAFLEDEEFEFVHKFGVMNFCGCWMLSLLRQHRNPVPGMLQLKLKFFDADPKTVGELYQFMAEYAFTKNNVDGKYKDLTWNEYCALMDQPFRIAIDNKDFDPKVEKLEAERFNGELVVRHLKTQTHIYSDADVNRLYLAYAASIKDEEKRKLFIVGDKVRPDVFHRTIEECVSFGSPLKRASIMERRVKQMTGEEPQKEYTEGTESGYTRH